MAQQQQLRQRRRRTFRERRDFLTEYSDSQLIERFRLDRAGILYVTDLVRDALGSRTARNKALSPEMKVAITLRYLATGKMQVCSGDDLGTSQPTASRAITQTLQALAQRDNFRRFINFPLTQQETQRKQEQFKQVAGFPGVVGVVDGTHIRIIAPREHEGEYVNQKRFHSINVQVVFDATYRILDIVAKWPGSVSDARVFSESGLKQLFERGIVPLGCHLLGDSAYAMERWLLTPYLCPQPGPQSRYNRAHTATRSVVERGIGQLKQRFRVLQGEIRLDPTKTSKLIYVCAMLHNLCQDRNIPLPDDDGIHHHHHHHHPDGEEGEGERDASNVGIINPEPTVTQMQDQFANLYFNNDE